MVLCLNVLTKLRRSEDGESPCSNIWQVIRHQAVGTEGEGLLGSNLKEVFQEPSRDAWRAEIGDAIACAESEEVGPAADVVLFWEADEFVETLGGFEGKRHSGLPVREYTAWL